MNPVTERYLNAINKLISDKKVNSIRQFAFSVGLQPSQISEAKAGKREIPDKYLHEMESVYNVNIQYLATGEGDFYGEPKKPEINAMAIGEIHRDENGSPYIEVGNGQFLMIVPLIPIKASASYRERYLDENYIDSHYDKHYFPVTRQYRGRYFAFVVDGDSMDDGTSEAIIEGSTVTGREIQKKYWTNKFHLNSFKDYVIVHPDMILVKRIIAHDTDNGTITCHSLNPDKNKHADFVLKLDECLQILNVVNVTQPR